jgi:hypothetical protein
MYARGLSETWAGLNATHIHSDPSTIYQKSRPCSICKQIAFTLTGKGQHANFRTIVRSWRFFKKKAHCSRIKVNAFKEKANTLGTKANASKKKALASATKANA